MSFELAKVNDVFSDFNAQLAVVKKENEQTVFDYESKEGNAAARSLIRKLGSSKTAIANAHKDAKADALEFGRALDAEKKRLTVVIEEMIQVHKEPIKAIEEREKQRKALIESNINSIKDCLDMEFETSALARIKYKEIKDTIIDDSYGEFKEQAELAKYKALESIEEKGKLLKEKEEKQAELERIEKEKAEQERIEAKKKAEQERIANEKRIADEATQKAQLEAKEKAEIAEKDKQEALAKVEREKAAALAKVEQDKKDAIAKAQRDAQDKINAEKKRIADDQAKLEAERIEAEKKEVKRQANRAHQKRINNTVLEYLKQLGCDDALGKKIITSLAKQEIPNVTINY